MTHLRLLVLQSLQVYLGATVARFRSTKTQALLVYLAMESDRPHRREALAGMLWPDQPQRQAQHNLSQALLNLRAALGARDAEGAFIEATRQTIRFNPESDHWLDARELLQRIAAAQAHAHPDGALCPICAEELARAIDLYHGPFLSGFGASTSDLFEEWAHTRRERISQQVSAALMQLIHYHEQRGDDERAERYARRLVALDPIRESAHRLLMRVLALSGQRGAALAHYMICRRTLAEELGAEPSRETEILAEQIRSGAIGIGRTPLSDVIHSASNSAPRRAELSLAHLPQPGMVIGRQSELLTLQRWLIDERAQMVAILGMGGVGKTSLAARLVEQVADSFERVIWRSLQNAPPPADLILDVLQILAAAPSPERTPDRLDTQIDLLLEALQRSRCLLVLDNVESIFQHGGRAGDYRPGYGEYGQIFERVGGGRHQSCLLLTSREQPINLRRLVGPSGPLRTLKVDGLSPPVGRILLQEYGVRGADSDLEALSAHYSGNPLALQLIGQTVGELYGGDAAAFLSHGTLIFDTIRDVLDQHLGRLSELEQDVLVWLAIGQEPVTLSTLSDRLSPLIPARALVEAAGSLRRRSLIELYGDRLALQQMVHEYLTDQIVIRVSQEIIGGSPNWMARYSLLQSQAEEYVRQSQERQLLRPVAQALLAHTDAAGATALLHALLARLRASDTPPRGYTAGTILNLLLHLGQDLRGYDFSGLSVWQADLRGAALRGVDFRRADLAGSAFTEVFQVAASLAFSPDGQRLAGGTANGVICLWSFEEGQLVERIEAHPQSIWSVAFSPDGRRLASAGEDRTIQIRNVADGSPRNPLIGHQGWVRSIAFSPDGRLLVSGSDDTTLRLWRADHGDLVGVLEGHASRVRTVAFSPDGRLLASGSADQSVRLWDVASGLCVRVLEGHTSRVRAVAFSPDGRLLASASHDHRVILWDVASGGILHTLQGHTSWAQAIAFSPDGRLIASAGADRSVWLWATSSGAPQLILQGHQHSVESLAFHPSGEALASSSRDQTVRLWEIATGRSIWRLHGHTNRVRTAAVSPDGATLASTSADAMIWLWDLEHRRVRSKVQGRIGLIEALAISPNGQLLACAGEQGVQLSDTSTGRVQQLYEGQDGIYTVAFGHAGALLACGGRRQTIEIWDVQAGQRRQLLSGHTDWVKTVAFHPGGELLASGSDDRTVRIWDLTRSLAPVVLRGHRNSVSSVAFSPDGQLLASGSNDWSVCLWDVASGEQRARLPDHQNSVTTVAFSPDGRLLASAGLDQSVRLFDVHEQRPVRALHGHTGTIRSVAFSPDGALLISSSDDETVRLWDVATGRSVATLRAPGPYDGMQIAGATGLSAAQRQTLITLGAVES